MILADKIIKLRKEQGWSQEELAHQLQVSRQSVSKWESMVSVPDLDKIIKLSQLFGVSTDYLLKDDAPEEAGFAPDTEAPCEAARRTVAMEEAHAYLRQAASSAWRIALGVAVCILSPVALILLAGAATYGKMALTEEMAGGLGAAILLLLVAGAVYIFITEGLKLQRYAYLEREPVSLAYGVAGMVEARKEQFEGAFKSGIAGGVTLCILGVVPLMLSTMAENEFLTLCCVALLLAFVAVGVFLLVLRCIVWGSFARLLEEGDYTRAQKAAQRQDDPLAACYWCFVVALYLGVSFFTRDWGRTWIIWPVAAVLFAGLQALRTLLRKPS